MRQIKPPCPFQGDGFLLKIYLWTIKGEQRRDAGRRCGVYVSIKMLALQRVASYQSQFLGLLYL